MKPAQWERPGEQKLQGQPWHKHYTTGRERSVYLRSAYVRYVCVCLHSLKGLHLKYVRYHTKHVCHWWEVTPMKWSITSWWLLSETSKLPGCQFTQSLFGLYYVYWHFLAPQHRVFGRESLSLCSQLSHTGRSPSSLTVQSCSDDVFSSSNYLLNLMNRWDSSGGN